ncbi:MAG: ATP-binding protein [Caldilineaceae bacterium]
MNSVATKLILAFVFIGVVGAVLVATFTTLRTRQEFDRFVTLRDTDVIADALSEYFVQHDNWLGVGQIMGRNRTLAIHSSRMTVVDGDDKIVFNIDASQIGSRFTERDDGPGTPILANNQQIGTLYIEGESANNEQREMRASAESSFLSNVRQASGLSALIAGLLALSLGALFARTFMRPVRELTAATQAVANGQLGTQVNVHTKDEIGRLAASFNRMSSDLAQASQIRKQMTADIAHDLRTPLAILRGYTEGLKDETLAGSAKLFGIMHEEVIHLQHLVEDLRTLSLADAGELRLNRRPVDPKALLERTGLAYVMQAEQQGIELRIDAAEGLPSINIDTERMTQVLNNLVANALRYTSTGEIVLSAIPEDHHIQLQVHDSGAGIASDDLAHIFDRFYRSDKSRQRSEQGESGLGLAIARAIVEAHGGTIRAESEVGVGSTFTIVLAQAQAN